MNTHRPSRSEHIRIRDVNYHIRHWGEAGAPVLFFLHGWMDSSATFQFVVDALQQEWKIIAPDWRGYGRSEWLGRPYWFPDYYADLDALLAHYSPEQPAQIVGHSMSAGIAASYAGLRPQRLARLVMLDFLGLKPEPSVDAAHTLDYWLQQVATPPRLRHYPDAAALAQQLRLMNPRLTPARAQFLAENVGCRLANGAYQMACDPWHKVPAPLPYRFEDSHSVWRHIQAPTLLINAEHGYVHERFGQDGPEFWTRASAIPQLQVARLPDAGHNLQHDQPEALATLIEGFMERGK